MSRIQALVVKLNMNQKLSCTSPGTQMIPVDRNLAVHITTLVVIHISCMHMLMCMQIVSCMSVGQIGDKSAEGSLESSKIMKRT